MILEQEKQSIIHQNKKFKKQNKSGDKEEKATEKPSQASFSQKIKLREGTCYYCGKPGHILSDSPEAASTSKDEW